MTDEWNAILDAWPNCTTPDCENKDCTWVGLGLCHPCSVRAIGKAECDRRYEATHGTDANGDRYLL